jgi:O-antigen ligase
MLVGVVFFFVEHNVRTAQYEAFSPWSSAAGSLEAGHNVAKGLALGLIGLLGGYLALRSDGRPLRFSGWLTALMLCYVGWLAASVLWSIDPGMSCRRLATLLFFILGAVGFARQFRPRDVALMAIVVGGGYLAVGVGTELALGTFHPWSPEYRFAGTIHPNAQGVQLAVLCLASFCLAAAATRGRTWLWACFAVGLVFLVLTKSRASCASLLIAMAALWLATASGRARALAALTTGLAVSTVALAASFSRADVSDRLLEAVMLGRQEQSEGLTGRVPLWNELFGYVRARPLEGYGYMAFWTEKNIEDLSADMEWTLREAHNGYLETVLGVGLIGGAILLAVVVVGLGRAAAGYRATGDPGLAFLLGLLAFCLADACLESGVPNFTALLAEIGLVQLMTLQAANERPFIDFRRRNGAIAAG